MKILPTTIDCTVLFTLSLKNIPNFLSFITNLKKYLVLILLQVLRKDQIHIVYKRLEFAVLSISLFTFSPISKQTAE